MASKMAEFLVHLIPYGIEDVQIVEDRASLPTEIQLLEALSEKCETVRQGSLKENTKETINKFLHAKDFLVVTHTDENNKMNHGTIRHFQNKASGINNLPDVVFSQNTTSPKPRRGSSAELNASTESSCTVDTIDSSSDVVSLPIENGNSTTTCWRETLKELLDDEGDEDVNERNNQQRFYCSYTNLDYSSFSPVRDTIPQKPLRSNSQENRGGIDAFLSFKYTILPLWQRTEGGQVGSVQPSLCINKMASKMAEFPGHLIPYGIEDVQIVEDRASLSTEIQLLEALSEKCETVRQGSLKENTKETINKFLHAKDFLVVTHTDENNKMDHGTVRRFQNKASGINNLPDVVFSQNTTSPKPRRGSSAELNASTESSCTVDTIDSSSDVVSLPMDNGNSATTCWREALKELLDDEGDEDVNERNNQQRFYCSYTNLDYSSFPPARDTIPQKPLRSNSQSGIDSFLSCVYNSAFLTTDRVGQVDSIQPNSSPLLSKMGGSYISQEKLAFPERVSSGRSTQECINLSSRCLAFFDDDQVLPERRDLAKQRRDDDAPRCCEKVRERRTGGEGKHVFMASRGKDLSVPLDENQCISLHHKKNKFTAANLRTLLVSLKPVFTTLQLTSTACQSGTSVPA